MAVLDHQDSRSSFLPSFSKVAQTFVVPSDGFYSLSSVMLSLFYDDRGEAATLTVYIYEIDSNGKPTTLVATMGSVSTGSLPGEYDTPVDFTFNGENPELSPGTEYAIVAVNDNPPTFGEYSNICMWSKNSSYNHTWFIPDGSTEWSATNKPPRFSADGTFLHAPDPPVKASNPDPADNAIDIDPALDVIMWSTGGDAASVDVYFGPAGDMVLLESAWTEGDYYVISGLVASAEYEWRIDTTNEFGTTEGDVWSFTVAGPSYLVEPVAPTFEAVGEKIVANGLSWNSEDEGVVFDVLFREFGTTEFTVLAESITDLLFAFPYNLTYNQIYFWQINEYTVDPETGERTLVSSTDEQQFTTEALIKYPKPSRRTVPAPAGGGETMNVITGDNCLAGIRRIVVACNNTIYYEAIE